MGASEKPDLCPRLCPPVCMASTGCLWPTLDKKNPAYLWESGVYWSALNVVERQTGGEGVHIEKLLNNLKDYQSGL